MATQTTQVITTKRPVIPEGFRKIKFCTGGYKTSIVGKEVQNDHPVWAERRYSPNAIFRDDRIWVRLYTYIPA